MNQIAKIEDNINRDLANTISVGTGGISFQNAGEVMEYAKMMAVSGSAVPKHLRGQPGACLGIIDDAIRFQTSPYALARKSYFVNDNLAYEAQVIAGIVNRFAPLKERPDVSFEGEGPDRVCIVIGDLVTGGTREYRSPKFKDITPKNSPLWKNDPDQQHSYFSLRAFARRWFPEILLGMYDVEEMRFAQARDITPQETPLQQRLEQARATTQEPQDAQEGFDASHVTRETETLATGLSRDQEHQSDAAAPNTASETQAECPPAGVEGDGQSSLSGSSPSPIQECAVKILGIAVDPLFDTAQQRRGALEKAKDVWKGELPEEDHTALRALVQSADAIIKDEADYEAAVSYFSEMLEIPVEKFVKKDG